MLIRAEEDEDSDPNETLDRFMDPTELTNAGNILFSYLESQLVVMGFERKAVIALIQSQEDKGSPVKTIEEALELLIIGENGYRHDFMFKKGLDRLLAGQMNPTCAICGEEPNQH